MAARDVAGEVLHVLVCGRADELLGRAELDDRAVAHDRDAVAEPQGLGKVVRDEDGGLPDLLLEPHDLVLHVAPDQRVEGAEGLVVEHHLGVGGECARDADALLHPARELVGEPVRDLFEPHELQDVTRASLPVGLPDALHLEPERHVVDHAPMGEQAEVLEDHRDRMTAERSELGAACLHDVPPGDLDLARRRLDEADERADERRLSRSRTAP